jgi:ribosomal protein S18 acetylase RimI-like enzyme
MTAPHIAPVTPSPENRAALAALLVEAVRHGASVSFMHPLAPAAAAAFWDASFAAGARGARVVLGAWCGGALAGTVTLLLDLPPNQPHRGEIAKLIVRPAYRGRGIATALMHAAEAEAIARGRCLLVLDTAVDGGAAGLYERLGYARVGEIPDYALKPFGGLTGTLIYWKRLLPA